MALTLEQMHEKFKKIKGMLVYVSIQEPAKPYLKAGADPKPDEWKAGVVLTDEDFVDELEEYAGKLDTKISLKKVKTADFEEKYRVAPPEGAGKNVWVLTLRKSTEQGKTGKLVPDMYKPKVFQKTNGKLLDITATTLVGNGSIGAISVDRFDRTSGGSSLYLKNVMVTELVEYVKGEGYESGSEFEDEIEEDSGESKDVADKATNVVEKATPEKTTRKKKEVVEGDDPF